MVSIWGLGFKRRARRQPRAGDCGCTRARSAVLQEAKPGVLYTDLTACNAYQNALDGRRRGQGARRRFVLGERDMMTPSQGRQGARRRDRRMRALWCWRALAT